MDNTKETLPYNKYVVVGSNQRLSDFITGLTVTDYSMEKFSCPRCENILDALEHGDETVCSICNLFMQRWGNALEIWEE